MKVYASKLCKNPAKLTSKTTYLITNIMSRLKPMVGRHPHETKMAQTLTAGLVFIMIREDARSFLHSFT